MVSIPIPREDIEPDKRGYKLRIVKDRPSVNYMKGGGYFEYLTKEQGITCYGIFTPTEFIGGTNEEKELVEDAIQSIAEAYILIQQNELSDNKLPEEQLIKEVEKILYKDNAFFITFSRNMLMHIENLKKKGYESPALRKSEETYEEIYQNKLENERLQFVSLKGFKTFIRQKLSDVSETYKRFINSLGSAYALDILYKVEDMHDAMRPWATFCRNAIAAREREKAVNMRLMTHLQDNIEKVKDEGRKYEFLSIAAGALESVCKTISKADPEGLYTNATVIDYDPEAIELAINTARRSEINLERAFLEISNDPDIILKVARYCEIDFDEIPAPARMTKPQRVQHAFVNMCRLANKIDSIVNNKSNSSRSFGEDSNIEETGNFIRENLKYILADKYGLSLINDEDRMNGYSPRFTFQIGNALKDVTMQRFLSGKCFDAIEFVGIHDYLQDGDSKRMISTLYNNSLNENGLILVGNIVDNNERAFLDAMGWPPMIYRSKEDMANIAINAGMSAEDCKIFEIPSLIYNLLEIIKGSKNLNTI